MEWIQLWAGITFAAQNGDVEGLLTAAAAGGLHLFDIVPRPGGFSARCAAWHYRKLAALARRRRVRLRIQKRCGLFFRLRPLFRRRGLWAGCLVFLPLLLWLQGFVWFIEPMGLTPGQQARAAVSSPSGSPFCAEKEMPAQCWISSMIKAPILSRSPSEGSAHKG